MQILDYDRADWVQEKPVVIALGNFDGVHLGHQQLLQKANAVSKEHGWESAVLLFKNHTTNVLAPSAKRVLTSVDDKKARLSRAGIDTIFLCTFNATFAAQSKEVFIQKILHRDLHVRHIVVGYDYRFGKGAEGSVKDLLKAEKDGLFSLSLIEDVRFEGKRISSTRIREAIAKGEVERADAMLGAPYTISGTVIHGAHRGHDLGYATANLGISFPYVLPHEGVYLTFAQLKNWQGFGMTSVGTNPTFDDGSKMTIETNLFDFHETIYEQPMQLSFLRFERFNVRYHDKEALIRQLKEDDRLLRSWAEEWKQTRSTFINEVR